MRYDVVKRFSIGDNTAVMDSDDGLGLKNEIPINDGRFILLSVGMLNSENPFKSTMLLIKGLFNEDVVYT